MTIKNVKICPNDYRKHHRWERIGVDREMIIYQCSQCRKCAFEPVVMLGNIKEL
jgi:hypothetical protein